MKAMDNEELHLLDELEIIVKKSEREYLLEMKKTFKEFARLKMIPDECYTIKDSYEWMSLDFEMKSELRDDLIQRYSFTYYASGVCTFDVDFKTPKLMSFKEGETAEETFDDIARKYSTEDIKFSYYDSSDCYDSVMWNACICCEEPGSDAGVISDAFEKLRAAASNFTRIAELEFWNSFDMSQISSFKTNTDEKLFDLSADYKVYEGETFIGTQAYMSIIAELSSEDIVINKLHNKVVVESTEYFEFADGAKRHTYRFEPSGSDGFAIKERFLVNGEEENYMVGEIRKISDNTIFCCLKGTFYSNRGEEKTIIISLDSDAVRAFSDSNMLIATINKTKDDNDRLAFECTTMMERVYTVHTKEYYTGYMCIIAAIPYLDFSLWWNIA